VYGPFKPTFQGKKYVVFVKTIIPSTNMYLYKYVYLLKEKSEVESVLADVIQKAKEFGLVVREFLSDNGREFDNENVRNILKGNGIVQRLTAPYTPEQGIPSMRTAHLLRWQGHLCMQTRKQNSQKKFGVS
jgi:hypothetical protein